MLLRLNILGTPEFPRFSIVTDNGKTWDGANWIDDPKKALIFSDIIEASTKTYELLRQEYKEVDHKLYFTIPIDVEVLTNSILQDYEIRDWLQKSVIFQCSNKHGNGPTDDTLILVSVRWCDLKERNYDSNPLDS